MRRILKIKTVYQLGMFEVELQPDGNLKYVRHGKEKFVTPPTEAWARFMRACAHLGIRKWKESYSPDVEIYDGGLWSVDINLDGFKYQGNGDGDFPVGFKSFISAVSRLLGGLEFA